MFTHTSGPGYEGALVAGTLVSASPFYFYGSEQYGERSMAACREMRAQLASDRIISARELARRGKAAAVRGDLLRRRVTARRSARSISQRSTTTQQIHSSRAVVPTKSLAVVTQRTSIGISKLESTDGGNTRST